MIDQCADGRFDGRAGRDHVVDHEGPFAADVARHPAHGGFERRCPDLVDDRQRKPEETRVCVGELTAPRSGATTTESSCTIGRSASTTTGTAVRCVTGASTQEAMT